MSASTSALMPWRGDMPPHLPARAGDVAPDVLVPGDPDRVPMLAALMEDVSDFGRRREFAVVTGSYRGRRLTICSSGIGGPSTEIALVELAMLGARRIVRIGGMSALVPEIAPGDYLCVTRALGDGGVPALYGGDGGAAPGLPEALAAAASELGLAAHLGPVASTDSYYLGQGRPIRRGEAAPAPDRLDALRAAGALGVEMEAHTVLTVCARLGVAACALLGVHGNRATDAWLDDYRSTQENLLHIAGRALATTHRGERS
ncbi:phosphorylase family protein [Salinarimonas chemoclinalis]|uniref:phosphorylase family protein n=1 Tax=Salinarimonas chemoclinalis TaxID=3241599 RepID=UPI003558B6A0